MKQFFIVFFLSVMAITLTTGCESVEENIYESVQEPMDSELNHLYLSIDSLHNEYASSTRGFSIGKWGKRFLTATVDACVAVITAETGPGAFVCSTIASGLYDDYLDYVDKRYGCKRRIARAPSGSQSIVFPTPNPNFIDSIGYYHNIVIETIKKKGLSFVDENGDIDYESYYNEVMTISKRYGISNNVRINKRLVYTYIDSVIKPFSQIDEGDQETYLSIVFNKTYNGFNYIPAKTLELRDVCSKIIYNDLCIAESQIAEYGQKVNEIIVNSKVTDDVKDELKIANNIAVNSSLYWSSN